MDKEVSRMFVDKNKVEGENKALDEELREFSKRLNDSLRENRILKDEIIDLVKENGKLRRAMKGLIYLGLFIEWSGVKFKTLKNKIYGFSRSSRETFQRMARANRTKTTRNV